MAYAMTLAEKELLQKKVIIIIIICIVKKYYFYIRSQYKPMQWFNIKWGNKGATDDSSMTSCTHQLAQGHGLHTCFPRVCRRQLTFSQAACHYGAMRNTNNSSLPECLSRGTEHGVPTHQSQREQTLLSGSSCARILSTPFLFAAVYLGAVIFPTESR